MSELLPPGAISKSIRRSLTAILDEALPEHKTVALLTIIDTEGARAVAAARVGGSWKFAAEGARTWDGDLSGRVAIMGSW